MLMKSKASLPRPLMATLSSLCLLSKPLSFLPSNPNPNPRLPTYKSFANTCSSSCSRDASLSEMKSIGEIFHGLGSMHFKIRNLTYQSGGREDLEEEAHLSGGPEGIASVVQDSVQSDVIWEQRSKDVAAESEKKKVTSPGFSFSAAGMLLPYHLGVAQLLIEKGYIKETTPLAGSSAGAIVSVAIASGNSMQDALKFTKNLAEDCRLNGTAFRLGDMQGYGKVLVPDPIYEWDKPSEFYKLHLKIGDKKRELFYSFPVRRMQAVLRDFLDKFLPDDIHTRSNGRVRGYLAPRPATIFRNRLCIDGGLTLLMPPTSASQTVRVCAFPASRLKLEGIGISPDCSQNNRATPHQLLKWALEPAEDDILDKFFELGYLDAEVWAKQNPVETTLHDDENASSP